MENKNLKVAVCWYKEEQWERLKEIVSDKENIEDTYFEWRKEAEKNLGELKSNGLNVKKVSVDTEEMIIWAYEQGKELNGELRSQYAAHVLEHRERKHNKCIKNIRLPLIGTFKRGAIASLLKAPYAKRYM